MHVLKSPAYADVVDLDRYPIDQLDSPLGQALVARCRAALAQDGCCTLAGFLQPPAVQEMIRLARTFEGKAWVSDQAHNVYFESLEDAAVQALPLEHPAYDYIPGDAPLRRLYESDDMTAFIAAVLDKPVLYRSADSLDALQITLFTPGEELGWHSDRSEFSVTVLYQSAEQGGDFEYAPGLRTAEDECIVDVSEVLQGERSRIKRQSAAPGTLAFFNGHHALHRVTPVKGRHRGSIPC